MYSDFQQSWQAQCQRKTQAQLQRVLLLPAPQVQRRESRSGKKLALLVEQVYII